ncbi:putative F-box protein At4g22170 isoform X2 [Macadamia integrifolia]|uniref:putative F-box protein At4g22170 isoform X2 n=1 Tax=Macadamia integrifolia TaxID=60698 RepID=UPI001C4E3724|nr:putative F-box protein At4g22170 isoform X2 [Macadamia integrifolia]
MDARNALVFMGEMISSSKKKNKMEETEEGSSKWTDLPDHINGLIADRLAFPDIFRFGSVCPSWRSISYETRRRRSLSSKPYNPLVLFEYNLRRGTFGFFSFEDNKVYWINLKGAPAIQCVGCSQGWLVMVAPLGTLSYAWNPFTGDRITFQTIHNVTAFEDLSKGLY